MNIYLGEHFDAFVRAQVATGRYANASEVIREALRRYEDDESKLAHLRALVREGVDDIEAGRVFDWTPTMMEDIARQAREHVDAGLISESDDAEWPDVEVRRQIAEGSPEYR